MTGKNDVAVLGVGMHPWGKWGRNFVEYGVAAAQAALADSGVDWRDVQLVCGADTMRNGYPGYVAGATFAQALGWQGAQVNSSYAACASDDGVWDMMGNLHEWTADPAGTFRGGYYVDTVLNGNGCLYATTAHDTSYWDYSTGFRCCAPAI